MANYRLSIAPKISATIDFIERDGKQVIISTIDAVLNLLKGLIETVITP